MLTNQVRQGQPGGKPALSTKGSISIYVDMFMSARAKDNRTTTQLSRAGVGKVKSLHKIRGWVWVRPSHTLQSNEALGNNRFLESQQCQGFQIEKASFCTAWRPMK